MAQCRAYYEDARGELWYCQKEAPHRPPHRADKTAGRFGGTLTWRELKPLIRNPRYGDAHD